MPGKFFVVQQEFAAVGQSFPTRKINRRNKGGGGSAPAALSPVARQHVLRDSVRERVSSGDLWPAARLLLLLPGGPRHPAYRHVLRYKDPLRGGESAPAARRLCSQPIRLESSGQRAMLTGPSERPHQTRQPLPHREKHPQNPKAERADPQGSVRRIRRLAAGHPEPLGQLVH